MQLRACYLRTVCGLAHCSHTWKTNSKVFQTKLNRIINKAGNVRIQETLWRVSVTTVAVEKQEVLHILSVVCSLSYPAYNVACLALLYFSKLSQNFSGNKIIENNVYFDFLYNFCLKHFSF